MSRRVVMWCVAAFCLWTVAAEVWPETMPRPANIARALIDAGTPNRLLYNASGTGLVTDLPAITASRVLISDANGLPTQNAALTASRALASDASGFPTAAATTATELGYVNGVTSAIQTQLDTHTTNIATNTTNIATNTTNIAALRQKITSQLTLFVDGSLGSDSNACLASGASACATIQKAIDLARNGYDHGGNNIIISVADGTYANISLAGPIVGIGSLQIAGNTTTPANVVLTSASNHAVSVANGGRLRIRGVTMQTTGGTFNAIQVSDIGSVVVLNGSNRFGAVTGTHMQADFGGEVQVTSAYTVAGNATSYHVFAAHRALIRITGITVTLSGSPTFNIFASPINNSYIEFNGVTISGAIGACTRYSVTGNGVLNTYGAGAAYIPCATVGTTATGGQYL